MSFQPHRRRRIKKCGYAFNYDYIHACVSRMLKDNKHKVSKKFVFLNEINYIKWRFPMHGNSLLFSTSFIKMNVLFGNFNNYVIFHVKSNIK